MFLISTINKKTKILVIVSIAFNIIAISAFVYMFYLIKEETNIVYALNGKIKNIENRVQEINSTKRLIFDTKNDVSILNSYFIYSDNVVGFIKSIETLGKEAKVSLSLNSVDISGEDSSSLSLQFTTQGSWDGSVYLLALLESMPVKINIGKVNLIKRPASDNKKPYWYGEFSVDLLSFLDNSN